MKIGLIGLDTSHSEIFTRLLNDLDDTYHVKGAKITHAIPTFSEDLPISSNRFPDYYQIVIKKYGVAEVETVEEIMNEVDAIIIGTVDGRNHLDWFKQVVTYRKPVFIDKPVVMSSEEMAEVMGLSKKNGTPVMSSSALRFSESVMAVNRKGNWSSGYFYGPTPMQEQMPGYFWYGIHLVEMAVTLFGTGVDKVQVEYKSDCHQVHLTYKDGRHLLIRGESEWHGRFGAVLHSADDVQMLKLWEEEKPFYAGLVEYIVEFFETGKGAVSLEETAEIVRIIEEINKGL
ncbi:Gfo/Idh/MocA family oxidoreductase [Psychrobacillus sp. FSL K6-1267]|uniref:Gfo/Idh/MocA family oxidoreductase n=1 Tax=Psychrobacillus sp. FSL K6-1267 TaxID=2921543 RepID=UPI0030F5E8F0